MKVKAKWAVKANGEWHMTGDVFEVDSTAGLLGAVEVLKEEPKPEPAKAEPADETEPEAKAEPKPRAARTRRKTTEK